ncbi:MAG: hypothetical protein LUQ37_10045 [Methanoregulaceae archaeon]|nr:hypothetical protein [Methanoregulaceae archaeon]
MITCPICGKKTVNTYRDTLDGWCLMGEEWECPDKHYRYCFDTGYTSHFIGKVESLAYGYDSPPSKLETILHRWRVFVARLRYRLETFRK